MARARRTAAGSARTTKAKPDAAAAADRSDGNAAATELACPECGRTFTRAAALGSHRRAAHAVAGRADGSKQNGTAPSRSAGSSTRAARAVGTKAAGAGGSGVDQDALLKALFPDGIPASASALGAVNAWLAEADRIAKLG